MEEEVLVIMLLGTAARGREGGREGGADFSFRLFGVVMSGCGFTVE